MESALNFLKDLHFYRTPIITNRVGETAFVFFGGGGEFVNCGLHPATPNFQFTHTFYYRVDFVEEYNSYLSFKKAACKNRR